MIKFVESNPGLFTFDEYSVLLKVIYDDELNESEEGSVGRAEYANCVKRLKAYFVSHQA